MVDGDVGTGDGLRSKEPPRVRPPVFPLVEDFEGLRLGLEDREGLLLVDEDLEELEELDERLLEEDLLEEDLEELDEERLPELPPLASAREKFNQSVISGVVGSIVTWAKQRKAIEKMNQRWNLSIMKLLKTGERVQKIG